MFLNDNYVSVGCNLVPHTLDWGLNNLICFGACNNIGLYDPKVGKIEQTRAGHTKRVNCVRWIKHHQKNVETELISGSTDTNAIVWSYNNNKLNPVVSLDGHEDSVTAVDAISLDDKTLIATASADHKIKIWFKVDNEVRCSQSIDLKSQFAIDLKFGIHPRSLVPLLCYGGSDIKVHLMTLLDDEFIPVLSLNGHEDWIRAIDIIAQNDDDLLIASSSQDCLIKLWRLRYAHSDAALSNDINLKVQSYVVNKRAEEKSVYDVNLEANLAGHDNWIYGLHWDQSSNKNPRLLSASMDKTMIVWELDEILGIYIEKVRVGEVGGNTLGFYGCRFNPTGDAILAYGFHGAFHMWKCNKEINDWQPQSTVGGHFKEVVDFDWDPMGEFIISVSLDQTTRLHAPCSPQNIWFEIARPQVHGYDMSSIAMINRCTFASGADEKLIRAFQAPKNFIENYHRLTGREIKTDALENFAAEGASVPSLGLSNKAIYEKSSKCDTEAKHPKDIYQDAYFVSTLLNAPPTEETLLQNTLWPEVHKLYGHGNEIFALAANKQGTLLASACKAAKTEHAKIIIWDIKSWKEIYRLSAHTLTVTQMEFSPCNSMLLSASRDRTWCIHRIKYTEQGLEITKLASTDKKNSVHSRLIWSCCWSHDSTLIATASRDKKVILWGEDKNGETNLVGWKVQSSFEFEESVTAVALAPIFISNNRYLLAAGLETGTIHLKSINCADQTWDHCFTFSNLYHHHLSIRRLRFKPCGSLNPNDGTIQLASCGDDHSLRVYNVALKAL